MTRNVSVFAQRISNVSFGLPADPRTRVLFIKNLNRSRIRLVEILSSPNVFLVPAQIRPGRLLLFRRTITGRSIGQTVSATLFFARNQKKKRTDYGKVSQYTYDGVVRSTGTRIGII